MDGVLKTLLSNSFFVWCAMAVIIFGITQLLKLPIKACTKRIKNERTRRIVNSTILLIPFILGLVAEFLYSTYYLHIAFMGITGLGYGAAGVSLYGIIERFFKIKVDNPYETTEEGKAVKDLVDKIQEDGKITEEDKSAVKDFWKTINK